MSEPAAFQIHRADETGGLTLRLAGRLTVAELARAEAALAAAGAGQAAALDLAGLERLDTAGAWALLRLAEPPAGAGTGPALTGAAPGMAQLLETVRRARPVAAADAGAGPPRRARGTAWMAAFWGLIAAAGRFGAELLAMLGLILARLARALVRPREFRLTALVHHCEAVGLQAVPIVALLAFLIGVVLAFQGATQLRQFGAEVFVVDLIAVSILRELGVLLTSIIVAGRTASAYCAAIGSMKMREEIDAMRTLGLDPAALLFVPRVLALLVTLPILALIANLAGLLGGGLMSWLELGISPAMFLTRLQEGTDLGHLIAGFAKAPVFAIIIGVVGCDAGMRVRGNAESLGRQTSAAVVTAIFAVIVADALFSIFFAELGI
ncbi:MlaE family ABC transporter permease [Roseivivax sp. CAU 1761]